MKGKTLDTVNRLAGYLMRAMILFGLLIGSALLCTASASVGEGVAAVMIVFRGVGFIGFIVSLFFAQRLFRDMKKGK